MFEFSNKSRQLRLSELNTRIKNLLEDEFPYNLWVSAEIAELNRSSTGHAYLSLVERERNKDVARMQATIWSRAFQQIETKFRNATGGRLDSGMNVLLSVRPRFHEVYGLKLEINDIDPTYTLGEVERNKREILQRIEKEGILDLNRQTPLKPVLKNIAIISSPTAAGYQDFTKQLSVSPWGYQYNMKLFPSAMQGDQTSGEIIKMLSKINDHQELFDVICIIRGGGSQLDLDAFNQYQLANSICHSRLPVFTGIGHERDETIPDMVSHSNFKTPTAVAEFINHHNATFESSVQAIIESISKQAIRIQQLEMQKLKNLLSSVKLSSKHLLHSTRQELEQRIKNIELQDPELLLKKGYSITLHKGKALKRAIDVKSGDVLETRLFDGNVHSKVENNEKEN